MMTDWEREKLTLAAGNLAAEARARGEDVRPALSPLFHQALLQHPDDEVRLLELWDQLSSRPVL